MSKTWIITGASVGGIGEGIARAVLSHGDNAVITARSLSKLEPIAKDYPDTCLPLTVDMADKEQIRAAAEGFSPSAPPELPAGKRERATLAAKTADTVPARRRQSFPVAALPQPWSDFPGFAAAHFSAE